MNSHEMISLYENVEVITSQMLAAARTGDWEQLAELESRCSSQVSILKTEELPVPLSGEVRAKKVRIIKQILAHDREIRNITEPWMAKLSTMISSAGAERKLAQAYASGSPS